MKYYTLIASLPHMPSHFDVENSPITRPRLQQRLRMLDDDDRGELERLAEFLVWDRHPIDQTDAEVAAQYARLQSQIRSPLVQQIVEHRTNMRTIVSALRLRRDGKVMTEGISQVAETICRNWSQPQFGLRTSHAWIEPFEQHFLSGNAMAAERVLMEASWKSINRFLFPGGRESLSIIGPRSTAPISPMDRGAIHDKRSSSDLTFSFEAIVLYLYRWEIVERWTSRSAEAGQSRFDQLIEEVLGDHAHVS